MMHTARLTTLLLLAVLAAACTGRGEQTARDLTEALRAEESALTEALRLARTAHADSLMTVEAMLHAMAEGKRIRTTEAQSLTAQASNTHADNPSESQPEQDEADTARTESLREGLTRLMEKEREHGQSTYAAYAHEASRNGRHAEAQWFAQGAQTAEGLAALLTYVIGNLDNRPVLAAVYATCPHCGNVTAGTTEKTCAVCHTDARDFMLQIATHTDATTGATRIH